MFLEDGHRSNEADEFPPLKAKNLSFLSLKSSELGAYLPPLKKDTEVWGILPIIETSSHKLKGG